jgi:hypothetical protein
MNISDFPPFIRWADFRGLLGVREGFRVEDFSRLIQRHAVPIFDAECRPVALPDKLGQLPMSEEEQFCASFDWPGGTTVEGLQAGDFQLETLAVIRALAAEGEPMGENARAYLESEEEKIRSAKEEAEQAKSEAEWLERFKAAAKKGLTPEEVAAKRRKSSRTDPREKIDGPAAYALYKTGRYSYPRLAKIHNEAAGYGLEGEDLKRLEKRITSKAKASAKGEKA